jgi:hypothetical protein
MDVTKVNFKKSFLKRLLIEFEFKNMKQKFQDITKILSVAIFLDRVIYPKELEVSKKMLQECTGDEELTELLFNKLELNLNSYLEDENKFLIDRSDVIKTIVDDIQIYSFIVNIFESDEIFSDLERDFELLIKNEYEKRWSEK